jgi:hypothetical protein
MLDLLGLKHHEDIGLILYSTFGQLLTSSFLAPKLRKLLFSLNVRHRNPDQILSIIEHQQIYLHRDDRHMGIGTPLVSPRDRRAIQMLFQISRAWSAHQIRYFRSMICLIPRKLYVFPNKIFST